MGGADGGEVEGGLLAGDKVPGGALGERLGDAVGGGGGGVHVGERGGVPRRLGKGGGRVVEERLGEDGGEGRGDDDAAHRGGGAVHGAEDGRGADEGWVDELRLRVGYTSHITHRPWSAKQ